VSDKIKVTWGNLSEDDLAAIAGKRDLLSGLLQRKWPVRVCGEEAGDSGFACLLVGLGIRELSLSLRRGSLVRHQPIRGINSSRSKELGDQSRRCRTSGEVRELVAQLRSSEAIGVPCKVASIAND
jgi:signal transduction protein with GAF and PtsI domain